MRYSLRTLLILTAILPPALAGLWFADGDPFLEMYATLVGFGLVLSVIGVFFYFGRESS